MKAILNCKTMGDLDEHDHKLVFKDFIDNSVTSLSNPIPLLGRKLYATFPAWIFTQGLSGTRCCRNFLQLGICWLPSSNSAW